MPADMPGPDLDLAVILAGGGGTRLWPWTGPGRPKPLLPLGGGGRSLLAATIDRLDGLVDPARIRLQTPPDLAEILHRAQPELNANQIWTEPSARDTAPAIALAMARASQIDPQAVVAILPADQRVKDTAVFQAALRRAAQQAREGGLVVLGIRPDRPSPRFGYLELATRVDAEFDPIDVRRFVEKPTVQTAQEFLETGRFLWNAGMFVWRADRFADALARHAPKIAQAVARYADSHDPADWDAAPRDSIDYALMEKAEAIRAVPLDAGWNDVGSWETVIELAEQGEAGPVQLVRTEGGTDGSVLICIEQPAPARSIAIGPAPQLLVLGPHGLLVAPREQADQVKKFAASGRS